MRRSFTAGRWSGVGVLFAMAAIAKPVVAQQVEMGRLVTTYTQDFNSLPSTEGTAELGVNAFIPDGWTVHRSRAGTTININNGSSNTGGLYSYGHTNSTDRALGGITAEKPGEFTYNLLLHNTSGRTITALDIAFAAEQWRVGSTNTDVQRLLFTYAVAEYSSSFNTTVKLNTLGWTTVSSLQFNSPLYKTKAGHYDGNSPQNRKEFSYTLPEAIPDGYYVMLRWYDPDELEQDHGLAIDDVKVTWNFEPDYIPLPVELTKFTAHVVAKTVELNWTTASEQDSRHFEIERSADAKHFTTLGIVNSRGTTSLVTHYNFHDREPLLGTSYYRLKQVDEDLTYTYTNIIAVTNQQAKAASVYPTLAQQELKVELPLAHLTYDAAVYDKMGRVVLRQSLKGYTHLLDVSRLGYGNYTLVLLNEMGERQTLRFLKK
ncbi:T9SS C-terminal target domain-containing protein [uncultured Pontibacter sp.]|uniref:T9SS C-terminal target domain-containing protein n=1 Tax=uncultured Pontibacter sp. TaxID=453356 RepID=UPI00261EFFDF|nr:T9SS C-terminal target domain-containing protein [uncultured Pontibacter sp.]